MEDSSEVATPAGVLPANDLGLFEALEALPRETFRDFILSRLTLRDLKNLRLVCRRMEALMAPHWHLRFAWSSPLAVGSNATPELLHFFLTRMKLGRRLGFQTGFLVLVGTLLAHRFDCATLMLGQISARRTRTLPQNMRDSFDIDLIEKVVQMPDEAIARWWFEQRLQPLTASGSRHSTMLCRHFVQAVLRWDRAMHLSLLIDADQFTRSQILEQPEGLLIEAVANGARQVVALLLDRYDITRAELPAEAVRMAFAEEDTDILRDWMAHYDLDDAYAHDLSLWLPNPNLPIPDPASA